MAYPFDNTTDFLGNALGQTQPAMPFAPTAMSGADAVPGGVASAPGGFGSFFPGGGSQFAAFAAMLGKALAPQQYNKHGKVPTWQESLATGVLPMAQGSMMSNALATKKLPGQGMDPMMALYLEKMLREGQGLNPMLSYPGYMPKGGQ
jgi:hypothetical protein